MANLKPVSATLATYHPSHFTVTAQEVVSTPGVKSHLLWAACCHSFFAFLQSGEFTCPSSAAYDSSMLSWGNIQVDSHNHPSYLRIILRHSKTDLFGAWVSLFMGATGDTLCPVAAVLSYLSVRPNRPGPLFMYQDDCPLSQVDLVAEVHQTLAADALMCHVSMAIVFGLEPLPPQPRVASDSVSRLLEVVHIHDLCSYLATAADSYLLLPSVLTVLCFCMFVFYSFLH